MSANEVLQLLESDIPSGRQSLQNNHDNLQLLAQHCEDQYFQADDKRAALEETKDFTTHSLASVAYQIHTLASNFLNLMDLQQSQLSGMESSINHLSQIVNIHKEKVARREIGVITTNRTALRTPGAKSGILFPEENERPVKYQRKPIDYSALDELGHGVKGPSPGLKSSRPSSIVSQSSHHAPTTSPPSPPSSRSGSISGASLPGTPYGTLNRSQGSNPYRSMPPPVAPPSLPPNPAGNGGNASRQSLHGARDRFETLYAPSVMGMIHSPPPLGMPRPVSDRTSGMMQRGSVDTSLPPPPAVDVEGLTQEALQAAVSLPPPPEGAMGYDYVDEPPPPEFSDPVAPPEDPYMETGPQFTEQHSWMPDTYLEKVVSIYKYEASVSDELSFAENAVIYVIKKNKDDWWEGVMDGHTGLFPANYVEPCI